MIGKVNVGGIDTSDATATHVDIKRGKTVYVDGNKITGSIPNKTSSYNTDNITKLGNTIKLSIPDIGFYSDGACIEHTDNNWIESNIKEGVSIFGKMGACQPNKLVSFLPDNFGIKWHTTKVWGDATDPIVESVRDNYLLLTAPKTNGRAIVASSEAFLGRDMQLLVVDAGFTTYTTSEKRSGYIAIREINGSDNNAYNSSLPYIKIKSGRKIHTIDCSMLDANKRYYVVISANTYGRSFSKTADFSVFFAYLILK